MLKTILHPTDLTNLSEDAYRGACELARLGGAKLVVLHITPGHVSEYLRRVSELPADATQEQLWAAIRKPRPEEAGLSVEHELREGDPAQQILLAARETRSDLIVMGSHGRTGVSRWFSGSVAEEVMRGADCSVLVVKPRRPEGAGEPGEQHEEVSTNVASTSSSATPRAQATQAEGMS